jgi:UDP-N-acetylglucosamine transferase subunit ALG13
VSALVVALVGTDHHPFGRLVDWMDAAALRHRDAHFVVQHGATRPPSVAGGHAFLGQDQLAELLREASVVVCHAGPGTITDAREAGHVPLCVPRDPALGEHVDGHQQRFAQVVGEAGIVRDIRSRETFELELDRSLSRPWAPGQVATASGPRDAARALAAAELNQLMTAEGRTFRDRRAHAHR